MIKLNWRPYWRIITASAKEDTWQRKIGAMAVTLLRVFLLSAIYAEAYRFSKPSLPYENAVWSLAVYFAFISNLGLRHLFTLVEKEVQTGEVEAQLIKPLEWRLVKLCQLLGKNGTVFLMQLIISPIFLLIIIKKPEISFWSAPLLLMFLALTILAIISASCLFLSIGLAAFWLNDAKSVFRLFDKAIIVFGGGFVPVALLPQAVQTGVRFSPLGVYSAPTQLFNPKIATALPVYLLSAIVWVVILIFVCNAVWKRAQLRIEVNGG